MRWCCEAWYPKSTHVKTMSCGPCNAIRITGLENIEKCDSTPMYRRRKRCNVKYSSKTHNQAIQSKAEMQSDANKAIHTMRSIAKQLYNVKLVHTSQNRNAKQSGAAKLCKACLCNAKPCTAKPCELYQKRTTPRPS